MIEIDLKSIRDRDDYLPHKVDRDGDSNIKFQGIQLAEVSSYLSPNATPQSQPHWCSNSDLRWDEIALYLTARGKLVCERVSYVTGYHPRSTGAVCQTEKEVIEFFGHDALAAELYRRADIEDTVEIE